jgi:hypothetical protein
MSVRLLVVGLVGVIILFAVVVSSSSPSTSYPPSGLVKLTAADFGHSDLIPVGSTVQVTLQDQFPVPGSSLVWNVTSSNPAVLSLRSQSSPSFAPAGGNLPYTASFLARSPGTATLLANAATTCEAMAKSSCPDQNYTITIKVVAP